MLVSVLLVLGIWIMGLAPVEVYAEQDRTVDSLQHLLKKDICASLGNIGLVYYRQGEYPKAMDCYFKALKTAREIGDNFKIAAWLNNIGLVYEEQREYPKALEYYLKALKLDEELGNKNYIASILADLGLLYTATKEYAKAENSLLQALEICREIGALSEEKQAEEMISNLYALMAAGSRTPAIYWNNALKHYKAYNIAKLSLFNEEKSRELGKLEARHEYESDEMERLREEAERSRREADIKLRRTNLQYSGISIVLILLVTALLFGTDNPLPGKRGGWRLNNGRFAVPRRILKALIFLTFLLFFEFSLVLLDPLVEHYSHGEPAYQLLFNAALAALIFPVHSFLDGKIRRRI